MTANTASTPTEVVADVAATVVGPIAFVEPVQGFVGNESFRIRTATDQVFYLKSGPALAIKAEAWACDRARREGIVAPDIVTTNLEPTDLPAAYLIERAIEGQPISADDTEVLVSAGEQLRQLHSMTDLDGSGAGYGFLNQGADQTTWAAVLLEPIETLANLAGQDGSGTLGSTDTVISADLVRRLRAVVPDAIGRLPQTPRALLHGDLHLRHIYASDGSLTGFIDWGDALVGDPLFDLGRLSRAGSRATEALLRGYGFDHTPALDHTLTLYRTIWSVMAMHWEHAANGDWFHEHLAAITDGLKVHEASKIS
ncbi:MAG TPA: aminoglycoside phosphotransferase family protein [Kribbella sp.]|uniref:phosphotransferase family protein n=1 Tax=Kribbella sp. TaxID=1871183 RepID=UPI002D7703EC|nr:aminoglycoside phosphotransferase family protein [Kribbella sp.]HET6296921.1 aminoglycoside phosphotransferase family protein [Kribbella sp.]